MRVSDLRALVVDLPGDLEVVLVTECCGCTAYRVHAEVDGVELTLVGES